MCWSDTVTERRGLGFLKFFFFISDFIMQLVFKKHLESTFINRLCISRSCVPQDSRPQSLWHQGPLWKAVSHGRGCRGWCFDDPSAWLSLRTSCPRISAASGPRISAASGRRVGSRSADGFDHFHLFPGRCMTPGETSVQSLSSCYAWAVHLFLVKLKERSTYCVLSTCLHVNRKWMNKQKMF